MCGIAGIIGQYPDPTAIGRMTETLAHRGPDHQEVWRAPGVQFGHTRLSILDLSPAGNQPMQLGPFTLIYNGEIYNFRELREKIDGPFESDCDAEVVLHMYARYGRACVERFRGMFSFAIWDASNNSLFAARDRMGIKPLYYRPIDGGVAFASEIKALLELGQPAADTTAVRDYLTYKYVPDPKTIYSGIYSLPAAHAVRHHARPLPDDHGRRRGVRGGDRAVLARAAVFRLPLPGWSRPGDGESSRSVADR